MDGRLSRERQQKTRNVRDLTDFMNDMFFGTADVMDKKSYDLTGGNNNSSNNNNNNVMDEDEFGFDDSRRSNSARLTQGWLDEARRLLASSPSRSPTHSPRFAAAAAAASASQGHQGRSPHLMPLDPRDPLSRSARRNKVGEGLGDEIVSKSSKLSRNKSDTLTPSHSSSSSPSHDNNNPPRPRKSRFQAQPQPNFSPQLAQQAPAQTQPPRRSFSNSLPLSPPRHPIESSHRRSRSSSTCSLGVIADSIAHGALDCTTLNGFLKQQRTSLLRILNGGLANVNLTIVLSAHSNSTSSMVAAICHAWLVSYRQREENGAAAMALVVPVMNVRRCAMWKLRKAAWLFHHAGLDATSLLFSDEVELDKLIMAGQMKVLVVGQDILCASSEVGSQCTILTDNFCEDAYDLLQDPVLKKLLLAGILLDTQNLKASASITKTRDSEAVQLLLVGSAPNYRYILFDQLMQEQKSSSFVEVLNGNYGKPPDEGENGEGNLGQKIGERITTSKSNNEGIMYNPRKNYIDNNGPKTNKISPKSAKLISPPLRSPPVAARAETDSSRGKNTFFLAKWFGFGSK